MGSSHRKGKRFERQQGKWLLENDGKCPKWGEIASSTGRVGHITELQVDLISRSYAGEAKNRESAPKWLIGAWKQIIERADELGKQPFLAVTKNYMPDMHVITPERHKELLQKEKELEEG